MGHQELSVEELKKLLEIASGQASAKEDVKELHPVEEFVLMVGVKVGTERVRPSLIYHAYRQWTTAKKTLSEEWFFRKFSKLFQRKWDRRGKYYLLDPAVFAKYDDEKYKIQREWRVKRAKKAAKTRHEREKAGQGKVSGS